MTCPWPISQPLSPAGKLGQEPPGFWLVDEVVEPGIGPITWLEVEENPGVDEDDEVLTSTSEVVVEPGFGPIVWLEVEENPRVDEEDEVLTSSSEVVVEPGIGPIVDCEDAVVVVEPGCGLMEDCELLEKSGIDVDREE